MAVRYRWEQQSHADGVTPAHGGRYIQWLPLQTRKRRKKEVRPSTREPLFTWKHVFPIIVSVLALIIALRQSFIANDAATLTAYDRGVGPVLELDKAYLGNSDLRPFFYENKRLEGADPARARAHALAEMTLDVFENVLTQVTT